MPTGLTMEAPPPATITLRASALDRAERLADRERARRARRIDGDRRTGHPEGARRQRRREIALAPVKQMRRLVPALACEALEIDAGAPGARNRKWWRSIAMFT